MTNFSSPKRTQKRQFRVVGYALALSFSLLTSAQSQTSPEAGVTQKGNGKPNVIWVVMEDVSPDLAFNGNVAIKTPNLDALAASGTVFTNTFSTSPVCSPSRSAFFTGMYQTSIGAHHHRSHTDDNFQLPSHVRMATEFMRDAGYFTLLMGPKQKTDFNFSPRVAAFDATDGEEEIVSGSYHHGDPNMSLLTKPAWLEYKKHHSDKPFFAEINYSEAHRQFVKDDDNPVDRSLVTIPSYYPDHPVTREVWSQYLETVQQLDYRIGHLIEELKAQDALDNTVIFIFGDHGRAMLRAKQWLYDSGTKVPMVVVGLPNVPVGEDDRLVSLIDVLPTTLALAGIPIPQYIEGRNMLAAKGKSRQYVFAQRDRLGATDDRIRAIRSKQYKYIFNYYPNLPYTNFSTYKKLQYPTLTLMEVMHVNHQLSPLQDKWFNDTRPAQALYDVVNDPEETVNLAYDANFKSVVAKMHQELMNWQQTTSDQGQYIEDPRIAERLDKSEKIRFEKEMQSRGLSSSTSNEAYLAWWKKELGLAE
ncbi:MAG: sulfatase [Paraglaciecola polaris]|uniref:sulfatase family protein n=1 Tax=Paraglaciecola polaris TaxID=222814 RepID=UPI0030038B57|tara:strand:- start:50952 stop:52541 length:1590 start_codon:yes stop_codon:yes gene_type:complete